VIVLILFIVGVLSLLAAVAIRYRQNRVRRRLFLVCGTSTQRRLSAIRRRLA
jgi:hypothetical protein